jgi:hypothetical protein
MGMRINLLFASLLAQLLPLFIADCPPQGCEPFGTCLLDNRSCGNNCLETCKCVPGYGGDDCSIRVTICPDTVDPADSVSTCFNGGTCVQKMYNSGNYNQLRWRCDCTQAVGAATAYAGIQCEFPAEESCETGKNQSNYAFCTNGGSCLATVWPGSPHPGCLCQAGKFEGRHCEYKAGTAPSDELSYNRQGSGDSGVSGVGIFFIVFAAFLFVGGFGFYIYRYSTGKEVDTQDTISAAAPDDLALDEVNMSDDLKLPETSVNPKLT